MHFAKRGETNTMIDTTSQYPNTIDPMLFFQDNNWDNVDIINTYNNLIAQEKYDEANEFISQQENVHTYSADYLNAIENRIESLQGYLLTKGKKEVFIHSNVEPDQVNENMIWIE